MPWFYPADVRKGQILRLEEAPCPAVPLIHDAGLTSAILFVIPGL